MDIITLVGGLIALLWILALLKWAPKFRLSDPVPSQRSATPWIPVIFWAGHVSMALGGGLRAIIPVEWGDLILRLPVFIGALGLVGVIGVAVYVEVIAEVQPYALRYPARNAGQDDTARYWSRATWVCEKPVAVALAALLLVGSILLTLFVGGFAFPSVLGTVLLFSLWGVTRFTTLVVRNDGVTVHRYLDPTVAIDADAITRTQIDQPLLHRLAKVHRLTISSEETEIHLALRDPAKAVEHIKAITGH